MPEDPIIHCYYKPHTLQDAVHLTFPPHIFPVSLKFGAVTSRINEASSE